MASHATPMRRPCLHTASDVFGWKTILEAPPLDFSLSPVPSCNPLALIAAPFFRPIPANDGHGGHALPGRPAAAPGCGAPPLPESPNQVSSESSSDADELASLLQLWMAGSYCPAPAPRNRRPAGRFPFHELGRCPHKSSWQRLRGKRGFSYFQCRQCGVGWRQPTKPSDLEPGL
eukprot:EG_transcript_13374